MRSFMQPPSGILDRSCEVKLFVDPSYLGPMARGGPILTLLAPLISGPLLDARAS
jgi:hypothetical protein